LAFTSSRVQIPAKETNYSSLYDAIDLLAMNIVPLMEPTRTKLISNGTIHWELVWPIILSAKLCELNEQIIALFQKAYGTCSPTMTTASDVLISLGESAEKYATFMAV
jgi:hypothetical protein